MSDTSPALSLPLIQPSQAQKHVTHNEALRVLDAAVQLTVADRDRTDPPATPALGARHIVAGPGGGAWAGQAGAVALWDGTAWDFFAPRPGWRAWVTGEAALVVWDGAAWGAAAPAADLQNVPGLGIGGSWDAVNRLTVTSEAALFTHAGGGVRMTLNKAAAGETASLLFQTGYGGRAEIGTAGSDDLAVKVSADGASWTDALTVAGATGDVTLGALLRLPPRLRAALPDPAVAGVGALAFATDAPGGAQPVYSDGTTWRQVQDGAAL